MSDPMKIEDTPAPKVSGREIAATLLGFGGAVLMVCAGVALIVLAFRWVL